MKRLLLLLAGSCLAVGANAQYAKNAFTDKSNRLQKVPMAAADRIGFVPAHTGTARTTAAAFYTEDFSSGTSITMPTGWTTGSFLGASSWHWTNHACTGTYNIGTIASTTAADGWMVYDSDSIGGTGTKPSGWMQSPEITACSGHTTVRLTFQEKFREFQDSCQIWVAHTTGAAPTWTAGTYTSYNVLPNNDLDNNTSTANPEIVHINISSEAASQAHVWIRFVYYGNYAGGSFNWLVDDINLAELDPIDVSTNKSFMYNPEPTLSYSASIFNTPLQFVDSVSPVTFLSNLGANIVPSVPMTAQIYQGSTSVYSQSRTYTNLAYDLLDTGIVFPRFLPTAVGNYSMTISSLTTTGDADLTNNFDTTIKFTVTDTTWQQNRGTITGGYYLYNSTVTPAVAFYTGARFDVPPTAVGDTVSGFGVAFDSQSLPTNTGGKVSVQLYSHSVGVTGWSYVGTSVERAVVSSDISSSTSTVWADFRVDPVSNGGYLILAPDKNYAAMVQVNGVTTKLLIDATVSPNATGTCGFYGQSGTSGNDGLNNWAASTDATGLASIPMVRMYFGHVKVVGVQEVGGLASMIGKAFPNPANTTVNVPFTLNSNTDVTVSLTNVLGQTIASQTIAAQDGVATKATFATNTLANGVYLYTVKANGEQTTGRIVVAH